MCDACRQTIAEAPLRTGRLRLSEIDSHWMCTVVGTCLTMGELRNLQSKLGVRLKKANPTDYDIHTAMVHLAGHDRKAAKAMQKVLDRKHAPAMSRFSRAATAEQLRHLWREAVGRGEVAGACWAVMSHPAADEPLRTEVFGEIHMLSHQVGAATHADLKRIHALEGEKAALEGKVARQQDRLRDEVVARDRTIRELRERLDLETTESRRLAHAVAAATEMAALKATVTELEKLLEVERRRREAAVREAEEKDRAQRRLEERTETLEASLADMQAEAEGLETRLAALLSGDRQGNCDASCRSLDLCGRCILYVGGRNQHIPHIRRLVEDSNGTFIHHDGGLEEGLGRLPALLTRADAVLFPLDCVGHAACDQVKRLCKRMEKTYVPVPRSGLGSFMRALARVGEGDA